MQPKWRNGSQGWELVAVSITCGHLLLLLFLLLLLLPVSFSLFLVIALLHLSFLCGSRRYRFDTRIKQNAGPHVERIVIWFLETSSFQAAGSINGFFLLGWEIVVVVCGSGCGAAGSGDRSTVQAAEDILFGELKGVPTG